MNWHNRLPVFLTNYRKKHQDAHHNREFIVHADPPLALWPERKKLAYSLVSKPIRIQISPKNPVAKNIDHQVAFIEMDDKRAFLERLVNENPDKKILVFVRTKVRAERVKKAMSRVNIDSETIHSDKEQKDRSLVLNNYKQGQ